MAPATAAELTQGMADIDAATNELAVKVDEWKTRISGPDADRIRAEMTAVSAKLRGLGKDPENPVPTV